MTDVEQSTGEEPARSDEKSNGEKDDDTFGISDGRVPDNSMFSSSALNQSCGANQARLNKQPYKEKYGAWTPLYDDKNQYLDIDLGEVVQIGAIATQGRPAYTEDGGWYVESYTLAYGNDGDTFQNLKEYGISKVFEGNKDPETVVKNQLKQAIKCRWVRIKPVTWHTHAALRVELYKFTGNPQNSRKRQTKQTQKSTERGTKQNNRGTRPGPTLQVKETIQISSRDESSIRVNDAQQINVVATNKEEDAKGIEESSNVLNGSENEMEVVKKDEKQNMEIESKNDADTSIATSQQDSLELIETPVEEKHKMEEEIVQVVKKDEDVIKNGDQSSKIFEMIPAVSVRDQAQVFKNRPALSDKIDSNFHSKIKGASAVSTRSDGVKFIGKIKLVKKEEEPQEEVDVEEEAPQQHGPDYVVPDVVKERLTSYQDVVLRNRGDSSSEDISKRKSIVLEEEMKYRNEMESSVFDRLRQFKETERKTRESEELSKQEDEKRQSLKRDAEKRRCLALQKEKERVLASLQKQKELEEEQRRKREEAEAEKFQENNAEANEPEVPAVVNDRLRLFKESEKREKERQEALKAEAEKRRQLKEDGEKKRLIAEQRERERLQELMNQKQRELEEQRKLQEEENSDSNGSSEVVDGSEEPLVPAIVHDRIKMFKDGEKASKEKEEAVRIEAQKRRASEEEAERLRISSEETSKKAQNDIPVTCIDNVEEEIVVAEENVNVESEMTFDFMGEGNSTEEPVGKEEQLIGKDDDDDEKESLDLQTRLQGIDTHHDGYDPEHERQMLAEAEDAFRTFAAHQKGGSRPKRSSKTENLIRSFTVDSTSSGESSGKRGSSNIVPPRKPLEKARSLDEVVARELHQTTNAEVVNSERSEENACVKGMVKERANIFSMHLPPVSGGKAETSHSQVKNWIASHPSHEANENESVLLNSQLEDLERKSADIKREIEEANSEGQEEDALGLEEDLHATMLEISKIKRRLLKINKEHASTKHIVRDTLVSSESHSLPDDTGSERTSSIGSRSAQKGGSMKISRECKAPVDRPAPPVDVNSFNDDGDIVIEGNVLSQIKNYEDESSKQRKQRAELRKSLSLSHSSLDSFETPPPMGFGGPEFAKDKAKVSKECKLQRDVPLPPVDQEGFNEDGDCVPEGNVMQQIKMFSKR